MKWSMSLLGVGDRLPNLVSNVLSDVDSTDEEASPQYLEPGNEKHPEPDRDDFVFRTPRRPSRALYPASFYNGLDSSAGVKLLMSPAITGRGKKQTVTFSGDVMVSSQMNVND